MGYHHARTLSNMKDIIVSISDINKERCRDIAQTFNIKSHYFNHKDLLKNENLNGIIIATPSHFHKSIFLDCIEYNINILVEKPIAHNIKDAKLMIQKAKDNNIIFTIGHIERFNPTITQIKKMIPRLGEIYLINTIRAGPFPKRLYGCPGGVLVDLAVHDIDIVNYLINDIKEVYSQQIKTENQEIYAKVLFKIKQAQIGSLEFSWISPRRRRIIEIYGTNGMILGDYQQQNLWFYENPDIDFSKINNTFEEIVLKGNIGSGKVIKYPMRKEEPLKLELLNFIESIKNKSQPLVKPEEGLKALEVSLAILKSGEKNEIIKLK